MANIIQKVANLISPNLWGGYSLPDQKKEPSKKNLAGFISPVQLQRVRQDILSWREALTEAESVWYPQRVRMQRLYIDTILNGHVASCIDRRKDLTLLRDWQFCIDDKPQENITELFNKTWFASLIDFSLDAIFFGYSLIQLGDCINDEFPDLRIIKRWNVSPDRLNITRMTYSTTGLMFLEGEYHDWNVYVTTPNDIGTSICGYGLLYKVALYEIYLRNLLGFNGDFVELFAQPYRVGKTSKSQEGERAEMEETLRQMGSSGYAVIDPEDHIEFLETALGGSGYKGYADLEARCEKKISKLILGHADALDSTPGKLGSNNGKESPSYKALIDKQTKDGAFITNVINDMLLPRLRNIGFAIPDNCLFKFKNDAEEQEIREKEDIANKAAADIAYTLKQAGLQMDAKYLSDRTGIPVEEILAPLPSFNTTKSLNSSVKNKLEKLYGKG